jgi:Raf kinase inhibitor-like YbhB/YbcL family protein
MPRADRLCDLRARDTRQRARERTGDIAMKASLLLVSSTAVLCAAVLASCGGASAQDTAFILTSPDLASGTFDNKFVLNGFGCTGENVSPQLQWAFPPAGTRSFSVQVLDLDAPTGSGFWHWAVYNIPATVNSLAQGAGNSPDTLPAPAHGGNTDFFDTGVTGGNGNYGGPCPPAGDPPHRYVFTVYALSVDDVEAAAQIPPTGTAGLHSFAMNKALGPVLLGKASFTATYAR